MPATSVIVVAAATGWVAGLPDLASALHNLGIGLAAVDRRDQALAPAEESLRIRRRLAEANPDAHLPNLAMALGAYAQVCVTVKRNLPESLDAITEAISIYQLLAERLPLRFAGLLILSHRTRANVLDELGRAEEAADLRQQLDAADGKADGE